ncbi:hypothetical protein BGX28_006837 [Mortierella sp. GBA30]|nr:hypothetical protein BGX28_006837 [Mortierella sp. GBA30]
MVLKHPAVKLDWKVPEPIKAGSETLRGVLVISARELRESGMKAVAGSARGVALGSANAESNRTIMKNAVNSLKFLKRDPTVRIEHIEIDLIGVEADPRFDSITFRAVFIEHRIASDVYTFFNDCFGFLYSIVHQLSGFWRV